MAYKLCCGPKKPTHYRIYSHNRTSMQQVTTRRDRRIKGEVKSIIKKSCNPPNITREERKAIRELKEDKSRMVLIADKGMSLVVIDTADYKKKAEELLQQPTYQLIPTDPYLQIQEQTY